MDPVNYITLATDASRPGDHDSLGNPTEDVDLLSNAAKDHLAARRHAQAEALARRLITLWPGQIDGFESMAQVRAAGGDIPAARFFQHQALMRARRFLADGSMDPELIEELEAAYAALDVAAYDQSPIGALVDALALSDEWPDPLLLRAIRRRAADAVAPLCALIQREVVATATVEDPGVTWEADYASQLLVTLKRDGVPSANTADVATDIASLARLGNSGWLETLPALAQGMGAVMVNPLGRLYFQRVPDYNMDSWLMDGIMRAAQTDSRARLNAAVMLRDAFDELLPRCEPGRRISPEKVEANDLALKLRQLGDAHALSTLTALQNRPGPKPAATR